MSLDQEYVVSINDKLTLDRMNKSQIEQIARLKLRDWILEARPEPIVEPEVEE